MTRQWSPPSILLYLLTTLIGVTAFLYPFFAPALAGGAPGNVPAAPIQDAPLLLGGLTLLCIAVLLAEAQGASSNARFVALLAILVAFNSALRFIEVALPGPGGFTPIFFLITLGGYVFGAPFGFLLGALTLVVSAVITGGIGPWLPYQMLAAGWVGLTAPLCRYPVRWLNVIWAAVTGGVPPGAKARYAHEPCTGLKTNDDVHASRTTHHASAVSTVNGQRSTAVHASRITYHAPRITHLWGEILILTLFGVAWGFLYGVIINIWFWPYAGGAAALYWEPGIGLRETIARYGAFYLATSALWDFFGGVGNALLLLAFGAPVLRVLRRFRQRFEVSVPDGVKSEERKVKNGSRFAFHSSLSRDDSIAEYVLVPPAVWAGWAVVVSLWLSVTRNPLYLLLIGLVLAVVRFVLPRQAASPYAIPFRFWPIALVIIPITGLLNALFTHVGEHILFRLPENLPLLGGPVTLEAFAVGALSGAALALVLATFSVLNHAVSPAALVGLIPRALRPVGVVIVIALAFVPSLRQHARQVREAQAIRGHAARGWRDLLPLLLPLLIGGLERAIQLAEAMTARGFGAHEAPLPSSARWGMAAGLAALFGGWWWWLLGSRVAAQGVMAVGALLILGCLWALGRAQTYTPYRRYHWRAVHGLMVAVLSVALVPVWLRESTLFYYPYPSLVLPALDLLSMAAAIGLLAPVIGLIAGSQWRITKTQSSQRTAVTD